MALKRTTACPKLPSPSASAARVVFPVMKDTKLPVSISPAASVIPAMNEIDPTSTKPVVVRRVLMMRRRLSLVIDRFQIRYRQATANRPVRKWDKEALILLRHKLR